MVTNIIQIGNSKGREGEIATDQIRTVDKSRIKRKIGELNNREIEELKEVFRQMFCE